MPTLSSSLVKQQVASMRDVEEALARQVLYGGDLVTNLLELATVSEVELNRVLSESHDLPPAPAGALPRAPEDVLRLVPGDLALRHGVYPLEARAGVLSVAVSEPLPSEVEEDLGFLLGLRVAQQTAPMARVRQAIARDYGLGMDRRSERIIARLEGRAPPSTSWLPPADHTELSAIPHAPSLPPLAYPPMLDGESAEPRLAVPAPSPTGSVTEGGELPPATARSGAPPAPRIGSAPPAARIEPAPAARVEAHARTDGAPESLRNWARSTAREARRRAPSKVEPRRRGPYTAASAEHDLVQAATRDDVLRALFDFAAQYFEYSALFAVHGEVAEGRDASGPGADRGAIASLSIALDEPGPLATVRAEGKLQLLRLPKAGRDAKLAADLGREAGRVVLLLPIVVRDRCVLLLYGDHGASDVELDSVGDVIAFTPLVESALESVIVRRKLAARNALAREGGVDLRSGAERDAALLAPPLLSPMPPRVKQTRGPTPSAEERARALVDALSVEPTLVDEPAPRVAAPPLVVAPTPVASAPPVITRTPVAVAQPVAVPAAVVVPASRAPAAPRMPSISPSAVDEGWPTVSKLPPPLPEAAPVSRIPGSRAMTPSPVISVRPSAGTPPQGTPTAADSEPPIPLTRKQPQLGRESGNPEPMLAPPPSMAATAATPMSAKSPKTVISQPAPAASRPAGAPGITTPQVGVKRAGAARPQPAPVVIAPPPAAAPSPMAPPSKAAPPPVAAPSKAAPLPVAAPSKAAAPPAVATEPAEPAPVSAPRPSGRLELVPETVLDEDGEDTPDIQVGTAELDDDVLGDDVEEVPLAPQSRSVAYPAVRPGPSHSSKELKLPSVIIDLDADCRELVAQLVEGDTSAADKLVQIGEPAVSALVASFPGPITGDPRRAGSEGPTRASDCGPILRTLARIGPAAVPFLVVRTADSSTQVRSWATRLLGEMPSADSARAVARRLADADADVRRAALAAARTLHGDADARMTLQLTLTSLACDSGQPDAARHGVIEALADLREPKGVPRLVALLSDDNVDIAKSAHWALVVITRQDFGREVRRWRDWLSEHGQQHRIEWLIASLLHDATDVRRAAGEELKLLTKEYFGYYDDLPKKERQRAQQRYHEWWESKGKGRFGG